VTRRALPTAGSGPFLGREQQAAELNGFLDRVRQGRGGLALILGPAGIGKSRLLVEVLAERVSDARAEWVAFDRGEAGYQGLAASAWAPFGARSGEMNWAPAELIAPISRPWMTSCSPLPTPPAGPFLERVAEAIAALFGSCGRPSAAGASHR